MQPHPHLNRSRLERSLRLRSRRNSTRRGRERDEERVAGLVFLDDCTADATRIHVVGEVIFHPYSDNLAERGSWCYNSGPPADYNWSVAGDTLTLAPASGKDACGIRGFIWTGQWTQTR